MLPVWATLRVVSIMSYKDYKNQSVGSQLTDKIVDLASELNKNHILDAISIYGVSDKDGSATMSFEWLGQDSDEAAADILDFLNKIKYMLLEMGNAVVEQVEPCIADVSGITRALYRVKVSAEQGKYDHHILQLKAN